MIPKRLKQIQPFEKLASFIWRFDFLKLVSTTFSSVFQLSTAACERKLASANFNGNPFYGAYNWVVLYWIYSLQQGSKFHIIEAFHVKKLTYSYTAIGNHDQDISWALKAYARMLEIWGEDLSFGSISFHTCLKRAGVHLSPQRSILNNLADSNNLLIVCKHMVP